jgi:hypothetical protein
LSRHATRFNKRDQNETLITSTLAQMGIDWNEGGPLDGWIFLKGKWVPVEVKNPLGRNRLQPAQDTFIAACEGLGRPYLVLRTREDAIAAINGRGE